MNPFARLRAQRSSPDGHLGLGGAPLGNYGRAISDQDAARTIEAAWEAGIRYFDTAPHYGLGLSEQRLGKALAGLPRDEYVISTKVGRLIVPNSHPQALDDDGFIVPGDLTRSWDFTPAGVRRSLEESLQRLGLDHVDIAFVHDPDQAWPGAAAEGLAALAQLKAEGLVGAIGIGTNSVAGLPELIASGQLDVVMLANRYSLLDHGSLSTVLDLAEAVNVSIIAASVFATGLLATRWPRADARFEYQTVSRDVLHKAKRIAMVCERHKVELPAAALAFPLLHPAIEAIAVGMRTTAHVDENTQRFAVSIPSALWAELVAEGLIPRRSIRSAT